MFNFQTVSVENIYELFLVLSIIQNKILENNIKHSSSTTFMFRVSKV